MNEKKSSGIRIIGGHWRSRRLPVANVPGLRPTTDRIRETLFNWLTSYIVGARCLDLFAGTGALGFEALSRGAAEVVMIEQNEDVAAALRHSVALLKTDQAQIQQLDALRWLASLQDQKFAIVFLDPPFDQACHSECLQKLIEANCLQKNTLIYVEQPLKASFELPDRMQTYKDGKAGQVRYSLLKAWQ